MSTLNIATITVTSAGLTTVTTPYSAGDQMGTQMSFAMASASGIIIGAVLTDKAKVLGGVDAIISDRSITVATDNLTDAITDADLLFTLGCITFPAQTVGSNNGFAAVDSLAIPYVANASSTIYVRLVTLAIPSGSGFFGAVGDLQLRLLYSKDV